MAEYTGLNEGFRPTPYRCTEGKLTIGFGLNLDAGISEELGELILMYQLEESARHMKSYGFWTRLSEPRRVVLVDMCFHLGWGGFSKFKRMVEALHSGDYEKASSEMLDSLYAKQTPVRANKNALIMRSGKFPK